MLWLSEIASRQLARVCVRPAPQPRRLLETASGPGQLDPVTQAKQADATVATWGLIAVAIGFLICCGILFRAMGRGYDITDDAYSLIWISNPRVYHWSTSEFGFLWSPVYELVGGDIKLFRLAGAALLAGCGAVLGLALCRFVAPVPQKRDVLTLVLATAAASFWQFAWWLPTPSYNQLVLCGLLLFSAGLGFAVPATSSSPDEEARKRATIFAAALTAFGLAVVFLAKPPSAVLALVVGGVWIGLLGPRRRGLFLLSAGCFACIFLLTAAFVIDGSVQGFVQRKIAGVQMLGLLGSAHGTGAMVRSVVRLLIDGLVQGFRGTIVWGAMALSLIALLKIDGRSRWKVLGLICASAVVLSVLVGLWRARGSLAGAYHMALIVPALLFLALGAALVFESAQPRKSLRPAAMAGLLGLLPISYSIGSDNRLIYHGAQASVFLLSAFMLLATVAPIARRTRMLAATAAISSCVTVGILAGATVAPYRLASSLWDQTVQIDIGCPSSRLLVDELTASYVSGLQRAAAAHGFQPGTAIIDLTGRSPGTVFALGGEAPGTPWLSGGYTGSAQYAREVLRRVPSQQLGRAWVLTEPDAAGGLPGSILGSLGLKFPDGFDRAGQACRSVPCIEQILWKPKAE